MNHEKELGIIADRLLNKNKIYKPEEDNIGIPPQGDDHIDTLKTGIQLIAEERQRQIEVLGYDSVHDAEHTEQELAGAAACYAMPAGRRVLTDTFVGVPIDFPFGKEYWEPTPENRILELQKAGALIAAEIDRLQHKLL